MSKDLGKFIIRLYATDIAVEVLKHLVERRDTSVKISSIISERLEAMIDELKARGEL